MGGRQSFFAVSCTTERRWVFPQVHEATFPKFFSLPGGTPDSRMMRDPIWSTWAKYYKDVNDTRVLHFARAISKHGFNNSQVGGASVWWWA